MVEDVQDAQPAAADVTAATKARLELEKTRLERAKLALEIRLKRRELRAHATKSWREVFVNPLVLAIAGGSITLLTSVVTNYLTATATREADERKATQARDSEGRALQSELIKTFLKTPDSKIARDNLSFLIESGLIPDHEKRIKEYLANNSKAVPKLGDGTSAASPYPACPAVDLAGVPTDASGPPIGVSLHFATNRLNANSYGGWDGALLGAVPDANAMQRMASKLGYRTNLFIDAVARADCLVTALSLLAGRLKSGDTLLLTMSGHGGQIPDLSGLEPDKQLETWVLYDKQIDANELSGHLSKFAQGVLVIVIEDASYAAALRPQRTVADTGPVVVVLAGTQENQVAMDSDAGRNGAFTSALLSVWNDGKFDGSYQNLINKIQARMPASQKPQLYVYGQLAGDKAARPFALSMGAAKP